LAVSIAKKAAALARMPSVPVAIDLSVMAKKTQDMLNDSLDALVNMDVDLAEDVCARDDQVDLFKREVRQRVQELIETAPQNVKPLLTYMSASRNLERIADHATNIAEDVIYMVNGTIVRHAAHG
jgi:phosphate transport system protein